MSPAIAGLVGALNEVHDGVGDMVSLGMIGTDMLMSGDPLGVLLYGVGQLWDAAIQSRQKVIDNDEPDKEYGTKMGYVREGDTWYPAIFNQRYKSTGLFASDQQITLDYGHDVVWKMDGEGKFVPMIPGAKSKNFVASDDEWLGEKKTGPGGNYAVLSSKEFVTGNAFGPGVDGHRAMNDTVRDWYFLSPDEMKKVMSGEEHLESYSDDIATMTAPCGSSTTGEGARLRARLEVELCLAVHGQVGLGQQLRRQRGGSNGSCTRAPACWMGCLRAARLTTTCTSRTAPTALGTSLSRDTR